MQLDFHYYATYAAACLAGYTHEQALDIAYSAQFVDCCSVTLISKVKGPKAAATTQLQIEMMENRTDLIGLVDITRIWASFHFLPADLNAPVKAFSKAYRDKYRLICGPNGGLLIDTVSAAKNKSLQAIGIAMHVLADTWAHRYFAGTPSFVINNTNYHFYEIMEDECGVEVSRQIKFAHNPTASDDIEKEYYVGTIYNAQENTIMNLGHGRAGHLPDYSFIKYRYLPSWGDYEEIVKDNPDDYYHAFCQMVYAMQFLHGDIDVFEVDKYAYDTVAPWEEYIKKIIKTRQMDASSDWKKLGELISGRSIPDFDIETYQSAYVNADDKDNTFLGRFFIAALAHKSLIVSRLFNSGNLLAGVSMDYRLHGQKGIRDYWKLLNIDQSNSGGKNDE